MPGLRFSRGKGSGRIQNQQAGVLSLNEVLCEGRMPTLEQFLQPTDVLGETIACVELLVKTPQLSGGRIGDAKMTALFEDGAAPAHTCTKLCKSRYDPCGV